MSNTLFYLLTTFIWGSTWFVIKFQLGVVAPEVSIGYRFALASLMLFGWCSFRKLSLRFSCKQHLFIALQGVFLFCLNYIFFYIATAYLTSGINAVVCSLVIVFNIIFSNVLFRTPIALPVLLGALSGIGGICFIFWPQLSQLDFTDVTIMGMALSLGGTFLGSMGNILSAYNQKQGITVIESSAFAMGYGALLTLLISLVEGHPLNFDFSLSYVSSLLYLSLFGSVIAFGSYLTLLGRIGAGKAAYVLVLSPLVALVISTLFEDFTWTNHTVYGVALVLLGNLFLLTKRNPRKSANLMPKPAVEPSKG